MYRLNGAAICCTACLPRKDPLRLSPLLQAPPEQVLEAVRKLGLEGVIGKRMNSVYEPASDQARGSSNARTWSRSLSSAVTFPERAASMRYSQVFTRNKELKFVAKVKSGFVPRIRDELFPALKALQTASHDKCGTANVSY